MPVLYIITGSNGAGKSSVGSNYVPAHLRESVFDGDKLLMRKSGEYWVSGIKSHKECKRLAAEFVDETFYSLVASSLQARTDFAYEGHFTNDASWNIPRQYRDNGYKIHLIFFGLADVTLSETRVIARAKEGGHNVDPLTLRNNFYGNLEKLDKYFSIFDTVTIVDTSGIEHYCLVILKKGRCFSAVTPDELPVWFTENLPEITRLVMEMGKNT
jgi:predicted ABC-type ATPase